MSDESFEHVERQLAGAGPGAPVELRAAVLGEMRRELRAARWDRWISRTAAAVLLVGVGLNAVMFLRGDPPAEPGAERGIAQRGIVAQDSLVQAAAAVAEATDVETGRRFARQLAALGGRELSDEQAAAIDAAMRKLEG
jgi:hypothetical protein